MVNRRIDGRAYRVSGESRSSYSLRALPAAFVNTIYLHYHQAKLLNLL